jgi:hypothetical protein
MDLTADANANADENDADRQAQFDAAAAAADSMCSLLQASSAFNTLYKLQQLLQQIHKALKPCGSLAVVKLLLAAGAHPSGNAAAVAAAAGGALDSSSISRSTGLITPLHVAACCVVPGDARVGADKAAVRVLGAAAEAVGWQDAAAAAEVGTRELTGQKRQLGEAAAEAAEGTAADSLQAAAPAHVTISAARQVYQQVEGKVNAMHQDLQRRQQQLKQEQQRMPLQGRALPRRRRGQMQEKIKEAENAQKSN